MHSLSRNQKSLIKFIHGCAKKNSMNLPKVIFNEERTASRGSVFFKAKEIYIEKDALRDDPSLEEAKAIALHELAHLKYKHCEISGLLSWVVLGLFVATVLTSTPDVSENLVHFRGDAIISFFISLIVGIFYNHFSELQADWFAAKTHRQELSRWLINNDRTPGAWSVTHPSTNFRIKILNLQRKEKTHEYYQLSSF